MKLLDTTAAIRAAASRHPDPTIRALLARRVRELESYNGFSIGELARFALVEPGDAALEIERAFGVPLFTNLVDGLKMGVDDDFVPSCEAITDHGGGLFELLWIFDDSGFGHVLLVNDEAGVDRDLIGLCRHWATPAA